MQGQVQGLLGSPKSYLRHKLIVTPVCMAMDFPREALGCLVQE